MSNTTQKQAALPQTGLAAEASPQPQGRDLSIEQALAVAYGHWNAGQINQAELLCQKVLAVWPENSEALHLLGLMSCNWGNLDLAIDYLRRACRAPRAPSVYFSNLAEMCRRKNLLDEGEVNARRAVGLDATQAGGWNNLGIILQEKGNLEESLVCLERVIAIKPDYAEAYSNLGNTHKKIGQLDRAQACYTHALKLAPNYPEAHSNLANLLKEFGEFDRALIEAKTAIELNPRLADAYINAAGVETTRNRHEDALQWINALMAFAPDNAAGLIAQSGILHKLDNHEQALLVARRAIMVAPDNGDAYNALGQALQSLNKYDEALAAYDKASQLPATVKEQGLINKALLFMETNDMEKSKEAYSEALKINPYSASAYYNSVELKKFDGKDPDIARMEDMLASNKTQSHNDRMSLHFALGKAWLDAGNAKAAFEHFNEGNRMKRSTITYDASTTDLWMKSIAEAFPASLFKNIPKLSSSSELPIFIIGLPRSGTTLVEQILGAHADIQGAGELSTLQRIITSLRRADGQQALYPDVVSALSPDDYERIGKTYLSHVEKLAEGHKRVVDKMPANFLYAGLIALSLPQARIIHCQRNPVDTCLSCYTKLFTAEQNFTYDLSELGKFYTSYDTLMKHWRNVLPAKRFIEVDYENVVSDLEKEAKRLINFCELPWDEACLKFHKSTRPVRTASVHQVRQPIYKRSVGRWKPYAEHLTPLLSSLKIDVPKNKPHS